MILPPGWQFYFCATNPRRIEIWRLAAFIASRKEKSCLVVVMYEKVYLPTYPVYHT